MTWGRIPTKGRRRCSPASPASGPSNFNSPPWTALPETARHFRGVSSDGNTAIVGTPAKNSDQGSAYTFTRSASPGGSIAAGAGTVVITAADVDLQGTITSTNTVSIAVAQAGRAIDLGTNTAGALGLTDAELDRITASTLLIGDAASGAITVSSAITHGNNLTLTTATTITMNQALTLATNKSLVAGAENSIAINARVTTEGGDVLLEAGNDITLLSASVAGNLTINGDIGTRNIRLGGTGTLQGVGEAESVSVGGNLEIAPARGMVIFLSIQRPSSGR